MSTRKRQRVPVSCVVCKKRKVKCDQNRPACGGCQKNGVPHLCRYLDPHWTSDLLKAAPGDIGTKGKPPSQVQLQSQVVTDELNVTIENQRSQIEDLKRKLALAQNNSTPSNTSGTNDISQLYTLTNLTILNKIRPKSKKKFKVADDMSFSVEKITPGTFVDIYSCTNSAKLDPQLANLWNKVNKLQHLYKTFKLSPQCTKSNTADGLTKSRDLETCPVMHLDLYEISQTSRFDEPSYVLQNATLMESENTPEASAASQSTYNWATPQLIYPPGNLAQQNQAERTIRETLVREADFSSKSATILRASQKVWSSTLRLLKGGVKMNYQQAAFLLDYFFTEIPSRIVLQIYENMVKDMIMDSENGDVRLKTKVANSANLTAFDSLKLNSSLMIMLSVAMRYSLQQLRQELSPLVTESEFTKKFRGLFPTEVELYKEPPPDDIKLMYEQLDVLHAILNVRLNPPAVNRLETLPFYAACIFFMINAYYDDKCNRNQKAISTFGKIFNLYLTAITRTEDIIIWNDPADVVFEGAAESNTPELSNHVWLLWHETVHLVNLVVFGLPGYMKLSDTQGKLAMTALSRIISSEGDNSHSSYVILRRKERIPAHETSSLDIDFLVSRICFTLAKGAEGFQVSIATLLSFSKEISVYLINDYGFTRNHVSYCRYLERQVSLRYLRFFISYLLLLQYEEDQRIGASRGDGAAIHLSLSVKLVSLLGFIRSELSYLNNSSEGYAPRMLYELAVRISQPMCGYILRVYEMKEEIKTKIAEIIDEEFPGEFKEYDIPCAKIVALLNSIINKFKCFQSNKTCLLSKTWKFYLIFIKNLNKIEKSDFAKMHANLSFFKVDNGEVKDVDDEEKKCPVDHEALMKRGRKISAKESNVRGGNNVLGKRSHKFEQETPGASVPTHPDSTETFMNENLPWKLFLSFFELQQTPILSPMLELFNNGSDAATATLVNLTAVQENQDILPGILNDFALFDVDIDFDVISLQLREDSGPNFVV